MLVSCSRDTSHGHNVAPACSSFSPLFQALRIVWGFIESDFLTFAIPNATFGLVSALAGSRLLEGPRPLLVDVLRRGPAVLFFNFYSLLLFDLANQRSPESQEEDRVNKPWRPIPSGHITSEQTRQAMLFYAPAALGFNYMLGIWDEGLLVQVLSYYYNELKGGDGFLRDVIIAVSYSLANRTSLKLVVGPENSISSHGHLWIAVISAIILTTMHIQDLKDQRGDSKLGRKTLPLYLGDRSCRIALAFLIPFWSLVTVSFWELDIIYSSGYCLLAALIAGRVLFRRDHQQDARTWRLWCCWHASLYALPLLSNR
ncbi:UbiA prenyltransferase family [Biscogniauxia sp. FL1348]|nr:UbiA prenyltransferase family [Biscogniauxia sp. FL1348]